MNVRNIDIAAVKQRLLECQALLPDDALAVPVDYVSLRENIFLVELAVQVKILLGNFDSEIFIENFFKAYCAERERHDNYAIPFTEYRRSPTNSLYWDIATLVFQPATMKDMLAIVMPSITRLLEVSIPDLLPLAVRDPQSLRAADENVVPVLTTTTLESLTAAPTADELSHYVFAGNLMFDVRHIQRFPLGVHAHFYKALQKQYPAIAEKLYTHNYMLTVLKTDILTFQKNGKAPREALEQLKIALMLSSTQMTGSGNASKRAAIGVMEFMSYFDIIPEKIKRKLLLLKGSKTLKEIIDDVLSGQCVLTTANYIDKLLEKNTKNPLLDAIIPISDTDDLLKRYRFSRTKAVTLSTEYDNPEMFTMPTQLIEAAITGMTINHPEDLIDLILNFPPEHYDMLFCNVTINMSIGALLQHIGIIIQNNILSVSQSQALAEVIITHYNQFNFHEVLDALYWLMEMKQAELIEWAIQRYVVSQKVLLTLLNQVDVKGNTLLQQMATHAPSFRVVLAAIPDSIRLLLIQEVNKNGDTVLHFAARDAESLRIVLALYPEEERLPALKVKNQKGKSVLHCAASNAESLRMILALYPENKRLAALKKADKNNKIVLDLAVVYANSLRVVLGTYPEAERLEALTVVCPFTKSTMLHDAANHRPECLQVMLELIPEEDRLRAVMNSNIPSGARVLDCAANHPPSFQVILQLLPEAQRLDMVKAVYKNGRSVLHHVIEQPESLRMMLELIPKAHRFEVLQVQDLTLGGNTLLHTAALNSEAFQVMLDVLPEAERLVAVKLLNANRETVLHLAANHPQSLQRILAMYPDDQERLIAVSAAAKDGTTVLHYAAPNFESLQIILKLIPKAQQLAAVKAVNDKGESVLLRASSNPQCLEIILAIYPEAERLEALQVPNTDGMTVLQRVIYGGGNKFECLLAILKLLPKAQRLAILKAEKFSNSVFNSVAGNNSQLLQQILKLIPKADRLEAVQAVTEAGHTVLHRALKNPKSLQVMLDLIPKEDHLKMAKMTSKAGTTLLHNASNPQCFQTILALYPQAERLAAVTAVTQDGTTVLQCAATYPEILRMILEWIPEAQYLEAISAANQKGITALHTAARYPDAMRVLIAGLPKDQRLDLRAVTTAIISNGETPLHSALRTPESLSLLLGAMPRELRLDAVIVKNKNGDTVLHQAACASEPKSLEILLGAIPAQQRLKAVSTFNQHGNSALKIAMVYDESFRMILESLPEEDRLPALKVKQSTGVTVVRVAGDLPHDLLIMLRLIPKNQRLEVFKSLSLIAFCKFLPPGNAVSLKAVFELIPEADHPQAIVDLLLRAAENDRALLRMIMKSILTELPLSFVKTPDSHGNTLLHYLLPITPHSSLQMIFECIPEDDRLEAVNAEDSSGITVLQAAAIKYPSSLQTMLPMIPVAQRMQAMTKINKHGNTLLYHVVNKPLSLRIALESIPDDQRVEWVRENVFKDDVVSALLSQEVQMLPVILWLLPREVRFDMLKTETENGYTFFHLLVLHQTKNTPSSLLTVLAHQSQPERLEAVGVLNSMGESVLQMVNRHFEYPSNCEELGKIYRFLYGNQATQVIKDVLLNFMNILGQFLMEMKPIPLEKNQVGLFFQQVTAREALVLALQIISAEVGQVVKDEDLQTLLNLQYRLIGKVKAFENELPPEDATSEWFQPVTVFLKRFLQKNKLPVDGSIVGYSYERADVVSDRLNTRIRVL